MTDQDKLVKRIQELSIYLLNEGGFESYTAIAKKINMTQHNFAQIRKHGSLSLKVLHDLHSIMNVNLNWLVSGHGQMLND